mmetsp:Transcript_31766/g.105239  ORF Transcript_31766/g.105239 Transcript_31766/m.105239 type:complete len:260 (-) Transcript_31766:703-1482(-)
MLGGIRRHWPNRQRHVGHAGRLRGLHTSHCLCKASLLRHRLHALRSGETGGRGSLHGGSPWGHAGGREARRRHKPEVDGSRRSGSRRGLRRPARPSSASLLCDAKCLGRCRRNLALLHPQLLEDLPRAALDGEAHRGAILRELLRQLGESVRPADAIHLHDEVTALNLVGRLTLPVPCVDAATWRDPVDDQSTDSVPSDQHHFNTELHAGRLVNIDLETKRFIAKALICHIKGCSAIGCQAGRSLGVFSHAKASFVVLW